MKWIFGVICLTASLAAVSATFCKSADDCRPGYCCVGLSMSQMMGKGLCLRHARERSKCSEPESISEYFGGKFNRYCPCADGMVCQPNKEGITDPEARRKALRCKKSSGSSVGPDVTTASKIVTDDDIVDTTRGDIVTEVTLPSDVVTDDNIVDETLPPETDAPEETETPDEVVETDAPEEVVETDEPEEVVDEETDAPEEVVEEETDAPEEVVEEETDTPEEAGQQGPGGERPRPEDPDCEDWTYGC